MFKCNVTIGQTAVGQMTFGQKSRGSLGVNGYVLGQDLGVCGISSIAHR